MREGVGDAGLDVVRETVTRLIGDLKRKDFIRMEGSTLVIRNRVALEAMAA